MSERTTSRVFSWAAVNTVIVIAALFPVLWILSLSLKSSETVTDGRLIPAKLSLDNYRGIFTGAGGYVFTKALVNSLGIALIATVIAVTLAAIAAYAIARLSFPGKTLILTAALAIAMFPPISVVGPLYNLWRNLGLFDTWQGLIIPYMTFTLPLAIYTLSAFFREIPWELEQAAQVDGATPFQAFRKIIVPLAAPGVFTTAILVFIFAWNDFVFAISLTSTDNAQTVPAAISSFTGASQFSAPTGSIAAAAVIVTITEGSDPVVLQPLSPPRGPDGEPGNARAPTRRLRLGAQARDDLGRSTPVSGRGRRRSAGRRGRRWSRRGVSAVAGPGLDRGGRGGGVTERGGVQGPGDRGAVGGAVALGGQRHTRLEEREGARDGVFVDLLERGALLGAGEGPGDADGFGGGEDDVDAERVGGLSSWEERPDTGELHWSDNMFRIFGLEPQSVTPTRQLVLDATHPADVVRRETGVAGLLAKRCSATLEHRIVRPDKTVRHIRTTVAFASGEGERQRIVGSVQDVTSEHRIARTMAGRAAVSKALDEWGAFDEGLEGLMAGFAAAIHLCVGVLWVPRHDTLMAMRIWHEPSSSLGALVAATRLWRPGRASPIVGRAWTNRYPVVSNNPTAGASPELAGALQDAGIKAAIAIPAVVDDEALAVLEFLSFERIEPRAHKLRSLDGVGHEIGAFLGHLRGELCPPLLTPRQIKVLQLAAHAVSASDIAREMHLSPATVKRHFEDSYARLGVRDRASAVAQAMRQGLIT